MRGIIPNEIDELSSLTTVSLTNGNIKGSIPETLYNITSLKVIELSGNSMEGKLSDKLYSLLDLKVLNLNDNMFSGPIQSNVKDLKSLTSLQLHNNNFYGNIRREFKDLSNLGKRLCNKSTKSKRISTHFTHVYSLQETATLHLNNFTGRVPSRMCNLFKPKFGQLQKLTSDCAEPDPEVDCECCTECF